MSLPRLFSGPTKRGTNLDVLNRMGDVRLTKVAAPSRTMSLSTPIVSSQDGPRMAGNASNFGGRKAPPFGKGKASAPSNVKRTLAKKALGKSNLPPALQAALARKRGSKSGK